MSSLRFQLLSVIDHLKARFPWRGLLVVGAALLLVTWWSATPVGLLGKADAVGYAVCHRIDVRSFHLGDRQIPVCARCTGQYLGAMLTLVTLGILRPRRSGYPKWGVSGILVAFVIVYGVDGLNSFMHLVPDLSRFFLYEPNNTLRLITGTGLGLGIGLMLYPAFNDTVYTQRDTRPVIEGLWDFSCLLVLAIALDLLVLSNQPSILYPLALISASGVLVLLTMVYTMLIVMACKLERRFENFAKMIYALLGGFVIALLQIAILDIIRFVITGSWTGFTLG